MTCKTEVFSRNEKGQFVRTTGARMYRTKSHKGRDIQYSRWVWMQANGEILKGHVIHHKNGDKMDNRIENLECLTHSEHNLKHPKKVWNRGKTREDTKVDNTLKKCVKTRRNNHLRKCSVTYKLWRKYAHKEVGEMLGISDRQSYTRVKYYEKYLKEKNEPIHYKKPHCKACNRIRIDFKHGLCRPCYEQQNPKSKYYEQM